MDITFFAEDDFNPEEYLQEVLANANEEQIRQFHDVLGDARESAAIDLQRNVYRNYHQFVTISKEISKLEGDMILLRNYLNDFKTTINSMRDEAAVVTSSAKNEQEEVTLEMQNMTLKDVKRRNMDVVIEGLDKAVAPSDDRTLLYSGGTLLELSSTTLKARLPVSFFLYNDVLVVAQRRRNLLGSNKLVLDKCWLLSEISVIDIQDTGNLVNGFKVARHPEEFFYKASNAEEKLAWIQAIKRAGDEFILSRRQTISRPVEKAPQTQGDVSPRVKREGDARPNLTQADSTWLLDLEDELDVWSATREFEDAVVAIAKARAKFGAHKLTKEQKAIQADIEARATKLSTIISQDLADPLLTKTQVVRNIQWLTRLGFGSQAKTIFLAARTSIMRHRIRQLPFDGDVVRYIQQLAIIVFTLIKNSCDWYNAGFNDGSMSSGLLKWVKGEIEYYATVFRRQVFDSNQTFDVIAECLELTIEQSRVLRDVGLDLTFLLEHLFLPSILLAIGAYTNGKVEEIGDAVDQDDLSVLHDVASLHIPLPGNEEGEIHDMTKLDVDYTVSKCALQLQGGVQEFINDIGMLITLSLYDRILSSLTSLFVIYIQRINERILSNQLTEEQGFMILKDTLYMCQEVLPSAIVQMELHFDRAVPELNALLEETNATNEQRQFVFCEGVAHKLLEDAGIFSIDYGSMDGISDDAWPSEAVKNLIQALHSFSQRVPSPLSSQSLVSTTLECIMEQILLNASENAATISFSLGGVQKLVLDVHFILRVCEKFVTERASESANAICERAMRVYFDSRETDDEPSLKTGDWYDQRVDAVVHELGDLFLSFN